MNATTSRDSTIDTSTAYSDELAELIETFIADRFTVMDDAVLDTLYADLPDVAYLKGMVKGLRRNLMRQAQEVDLEEAYPKINAGSMAEAMEQAKQQQISVESNKLSPVSIPELMVVSAGFDFSGIHVHEKSHEAEDDWEDDSVQPAHLLNQDPSESHRVPTTREFLRSATQPRNQNKAPQIDRNFRSNLSRYGIAQATLADMTSNARPGGLFSPDTMKHSKHQDLLLVRSPVTRPREHLQLLEGTDPQYYQYMWMAFEEALKTILTDESMTDNPARHLDDDGLVARFGDVTANAAVIIKKIGSRDLLHVENVNTCIKLLTEQFPSVKLYTGDKVMEGGIWAKTWTHTTLKTPKGRFVFGNPAVEVVWQSN